MVEQRQLTIIITGPSGVGKGTVVSALLSDSSLKILRVSRHTTRGRRIDESEGTTHHFVSEAVFLKIVSENGFLEWKKAGSHLYGTALESYKEALSHGQTILFDVGVSSALQLQTTTEIKDCSTLVVFLSPVEKAILSSGEGINEAIAILEKRIKGRSSVKSEELIDRLREGREDLDRIHLFANIVVCKEGLIQEAVDKIKELILVQRTA